MKRAMFFVIGALFVLMGIAQGWYFFTGPLKPENFWLAMTYASFFVGATVIFSIGAACVWTAFED